MALLAGLLTAAAACGLCYAWLIMHAPLPYAALDFNHDGHVSLGEAEYAASYGTRPARSSTPPCTEYFALKDGLTLTTQCGRD